MELQGLQEALKVEIQCHQKLAVRNCPVGTTKPLSLIKPPGQSIAISMVPAKSPVSMVTAQINGQKSASLEPLQMSPINLQTGNRAASGGVQAFSSRRVIELPPAQMLGTLTALPIKVPQVSSSLHRLIGPVNVLPQVRPKTKLLDSVPYSPGAELQPLAVQRATAVVSPKSSTPTPPAVNSTFSPAHHPNGQSDSSSPPTALLGSSGVLDSSGPLQHASAGPGVAYAIIAAASPSPEKGLASASDAVKVQSLLLLTGNKVIIIQPQTPSSTDTSPTLRSDAPPYEALPPEAPPIAKSPSLQTDEDPEKIAFMVALGLVTTEHLEEIQTKRQERKRRSTANPAYSGLFEPERKRLASHYLNSSLFLSGRDSEDFCWKDDVEHDEVCAVCKEDGELQPCHNCPRAFHPNCLHPPLKTPPRGNWYCPRCQKKVLNKENMSWPQNFVQSYVTHKTVRLEEKRRLLRRNLELKNECAHLEEQDTTLNNTLKRCMDLRERLLGRQRDTQASLERLKALIRLIQHDQLIQVTMTTTATIAASLLSQSWIKQTTSIGSAPGPSATPLQKSHTHHKDDINN